jgi:hypothetical protein
MEFISSVDYWSFYTRFTSILLTLYLAYKIWKWKQKIIIKREINKNNEHLNCSIPMQIQNPVPMNQIQSSPAAAASAIEMARQMLLQPTFQKGECHE